METRHSPHARPLTAATALIGGLFRPFAVRLGAMGCLLSLCGPVGAAPVPLDLEPDPSFQPVFEQTDGGSVHVMVRCPDGAILVAGRFTALGASGQGSVARFNPDGSLDTTYVTPIVSGGDIFALAPLPDGHVLVGGSFTSADGTPGKGLIRLLPTGALDSTWHPHVGDAPEIKRLALQSTGRILVGDAALYAGGIYRLFSDGSRDDSFVSPGYGYANSGFAVLPDDRIVFLGNLGRLTANGEPDPVPDAPPAYSGRVTAFAHCPDGKVLLAGMLMDAATGTDRNVIRLHPDGSLDTSFDQQGLIGFDPPVVAPGPNGTVYVAAYDFSDPQRWGARLKRFLPSGATDPDFDSGTANNRYITSMVPFDDGSVLVAGEADQDPATTRPEIACITSIGTESGTLLSPLAGSIVRAAVHLTGGGWLVGGEFTHVNGTPCRGLAKLDEAGALVPGFLQGEGFDGAVQAIAVHENGTILVGGAFTHYAGVAAPRIIRLDADGSIDPAFNAGEGPNAPVHVIRLVGGGRAVLGGSFTRYSAADTGRIARVLSNGSLDPTFQAAPGFSDSVNALYPLAGGKLLVGGAFGQHNGAEARGIARLLESGAPDVEFSLTPGYSYGPVMALALTPDGLRIVGSSRYVPGIFWLSAAGAHLPGLGINASNRGATGPFVVQDDGTVIAAGPIRGQYSQVEHPPIGRILPDGTVDETFHAPGFLSGGFTHTLAALGGQRFALGGAWSAYDGFLGKGLVVLGPSARPAILAQPESVRTEIGATVALTVEATGAELEYQWYHNGTAIAGATQAQLIIPTVSASAAGTYHVVVSNDLGSVRSRDVVLSGSGTPPTVSSSPQSIGVRSGASAAFTVTASGTSPLRYVWRHHGIIVATGSEPRLELPDATMAHAGLYEVEVFSGLDSVRVPIGRLDVFPETLSTLYRAAPEQAFVPEVGGGSVSRLARTPDGGCIVAGRFGSIGGVRISNLARMKPDGSVDPTFQPAAVPDGGIQAVAVQADGRVLVAGSFRSVGGAARRCIARLNTDGTLDETFNPGEGFTRGTTDAIVHGIALQDDGKIIAVGDFDTIGSTVRLGVARLLANGSADETFGTPWTGISGIPVAVAVGPDGRIVVGGTFTSAAAVAMENLACFGPSGQLWPGFSSWTGLNGTVNSVAFQPGGTILIAGAFNRVQNAVRHGVARLSSSGVLDTGFDTPFSEGTSVTVVESTDNGGVLVGGSCLQPYPAPAYSLVRLTGTGSIDSGFSPVPAGLGVTDLAQLEGNRVLTCGTPPVEVGRTPSPLALFEPDGMRVADYAPSLFSPSGVTRIAASPDGGVIATGFFTHINAEPHKYVAKMGRDGRLDASFAPPTENIDPGSSLAVAPDGCIYLPVRAAPTGGSARYKVVRLLPTGAIDPSFNAEPGTGEVLGIQPDGRILVAAEASNPEQTQFGTAILRLNTDGTLDTSFDTGIGFATPYPGISRLIAGTQLQADGRILVGGDFSTFNGVTRRGVVRLTQSGALDATFDASNTFLEVSNIRVAALALLPDGTIAVGTHGGVMMLDGSGRPVSSFQPSQENWDSITALALGAADMLTAGGEPPLGGVWPNLLETVQTSGQRTAVLDEVLSRPTQTQPQVTKLAFLDDGRLVLAGMDLPRGSSGSAGLVVLQPDPYAGAVDGPSTVEAGQPAILSAADSPGTLSYQWQLDGVDIPGATQATYRIPSTQRLHEGEYRVVVTSARGASRSSAFALTVQPALPSAARVLNLSSRARCLDGDRILIPGFVIAGNGTRRMLLRSIGPTLAELGVRDPLPDPRIAVKRWVNDHFEDFASNDNWIDNEDAASVSQTFTRVGAFALDSDSLDSALVLDLPAGRYTAFGYDVSARAGVAMVEIYDAGDQDGTTGAQLTNLSNRGFIGTGDDAMICGFVVSSEGSRTFLIRVVGPSLTALGLTDPLSDPVLSLHRYIPANRTDEVLLSNDDWWRSPDAANTEATARQVGAFVLQPGAKDAAVVVTLPPGIYTVIGSGALGTTGVALVEVYLVP